MLILAIIAVSNKKHINKKTITIKTTNQEETTKFMKEHNFPEEMIQEMQNGNTTVTRTQTIRTVKYINGQKVSDTIETSTTVPKATYCPNCGAKLEDTSNTCHYCNQTFN